MKRFVVFTVLFSLAAIAVGQRYGHLNLGQLVAVMPQTKAAEGQLKNYRDSLTAEGEKMAIKFREDYTAFVTEARGGNLTPLQQQERQEALQQQQEGIAAYEQQMQQMLAVRRDQLLAPVIDRADQAIREVAKAEGFVMIFDTSIFNAVLFAADSEDVMPLVKAKLGISDSPAKE